MQRRLWHIWGRRSGRYVRARTVLGGTSPSRLGVPVRHGGHIPQSLKSEVLREDLGYGVATVNATLLDKLESAVVSAPHSFSSDLALKFGSDIRGGQFGEGALEFRFLEIKGVVSDRWGGTLLVDQVR
jgi:hypothetical protein